MEETRIALHREEILEIAREQLAGKSSHPWKEPGNKFEHGLRTAALALRLKHEIFPDGTEISEDVLTVAAWFHDVCNGQEHHEERGAELCGELLRGLCSAEELSQVCSVIRSHDQRAVTEERPGDPILLLHQDADLLDHLGTYDIWMAFSDACYRRKSAMEFAQWVGEGGFDRWVDSWRVQVNYPRSLEIFNEKTEFERQFGLRLLRELRGEYC